MKSIVLAIVAVLAVQSVVACPKPDDLGDLVGWKPCSTAVVVDGTSTNAVQVQQGQELVIEVKSNPTTGYSWQMDPTNFLSDSSVLSLAGCRYHRVASSSQIVGAGGRESWGFKAASPGTTTVHLQYVRPWEVSNGVTVPESSKKTFTVVVVE